MSADKVFQRAGPATGNTLAPTVERRTGGTRRWMDDDERSMIDSARRTAELPVRGILERSGAFIHAWFPR